MLEKSSSPSWSLLLVLGMHRSGTSAMTGVLQYLGVELGTRLIPAAPDNVKGFYESRDVVSAQNEFLSSLGLSSTDIRSVPETAWAGQSAQECQAKLQQIVSEYPNESSVRAVKDPRSCRTFPMWREVSKSLSVPLRLIFIFRNPLDVADSLTHRDKISTSHALMLWVVYNLEALSSLESERVSVIRYQDLLSEPALELQRIGKEMGLAWPRSVEDATEDLSSFITPGLSHHTNGMVEAELEKRQIGVLLGSWVLRVNEMLETFHSASPCQAPSAAKTMLKEYSALGEFAAQVSSESIHQLSGQVAELIKWNAELEKAKEWLDKERLAWKQTAEVHVKELFELRKWLEEQKAAQEVLTEQLQKIENDTSD